MKIIMVVLAFGLLVSCKGAQTSRAEIKRAVDRFAIESTLKVNSVDAINLLFETACVESDLKHRRQFNNGPARGLWQMEKATYDDIHTNFLNYRPKLKKVLDNMFGEDRSFSDIENNDEYAIIMARLKYWRAPGTIPSTREARAVYWKKYYNSNKGKGTVSKYLQASANR